jgi:hypothetical protein
LPLIWRLERLECSNGPGSDSDSRLFAGSELRCWPARGLHSKASWDSGRSCSVLFKRVTGVSHEHASYQRS